MLDTVATPISCAICHEPAKRLFQHRVLGKYDANFQYCASCDHIFVEHPVWLDETYSEAIAATDTDIGTRNELTALQLAAICFWVFREGGEGRYVDAPVDMACWHV
jgi:hypothetical protein